MLLLGPSPRVACRGYALAALLLALLCSSTARAGGYDAFMWHTSRHMGLGGAAVAYVSDPAAVFHNPAGLAHVERAQLLVSGALMTPRLRAAPAAGINAESTTTVAPFGLIGGALRVTEWLTAGVAAFPIAAAGASYRYDGVVGRTDDRTRALLLELSPALGVTLAYGFRLGLGYRITGMYMERYSKGADAAQPGIDMSLLGFNFRGLRLGAQWERVWSAAPTSRRALQLGFSYRHKVVIDVEGEGGYALATPLRAVETSFTLPARMALGVRGDLGRLGAVLDLEYGLNSQNDRATVRVELEDGSRADLPNIFAWGDTFGLRTGLEYRLLENGQLPVRVGYAFDGRTLSKRYPTAFGPPPTATHMLTCGVGYRADPIELNVAYSYRFGATTVTEQDRQDAELCAFCGHPGEYGVRLHGVYVDLSYKFRGI